MLDVALIIHRYTLNDMGHRRRQAGWDRDGGLLPVDRPKTLHRSMIAVASMAGTFATVDSVQNFWFALIATFAGAGVLYVLMTESPRD